MCRAVCENPQSGVTERRSGETCFRTALIREATSSAGSIQVFLTSTNPTATSIVSGNSASNWTSANSRLANSRRKLVHGNPTDVWKERPVRAVPHGTTAIIAEAHVHADVGTHPPNGAGNHIEEMVGRVGMAGEARFVKLDEIDARRHEGHELGVDDRNQGLGRGVAIGVDLAPLDAASQCERPGNRCLYRPPGIFPEPVVFGDSSQTVGSRQRLQAAVPLTLVMRRAPQWRTRRIGLRPRAYAPPFQGLRTTFSCVFEGFSR